MKITELSHVVIGTPDLGKWRDYGTKVLGMAAIDGPDGSLYLKMDGRDFRFLIQKGEKDELFASGWSVSDEGSFHEVRADLERAGTEIKRGTDAERKLRKVQDFFSFKDPAGLRHEVSWGPIAAFTKFVSPLGTNFITGDLGMGHAVLPTGDIDATVKFWTEVMGFGVSDLLHPGLFPALRRRPPAQPGLRRADRSDWLQPPDGGGRFDGRGWPRARPRRPERRQADPDIGPPCE